MIKLKYELTEVKPRIFLVEMEDKYDLCMTFLRYQEFYESPNSKFRGKNFTIADFMRWYSKTWSESKLTFDYAKHWSGFNIPSKSLEKCYENVLDQNIYDFVMNNIIETIYKKLQNKWIDNPKYYLIGASKGATTTINHEIAHGMFYLNSKYRKEMTELVNKLPKSLVKNMHVMLKNLGYTPKVYTDEIQAYMSCNDVEAYGVKVGNKNIPFQEIWNKYCK